MKRMNLAATTLFTISFLTTIGIAQAATIGPGDVIGIDFGATANTSGFNPYPQSTVSISAGSLLNTNGTVMDGIAFSTLGNGGGNGFNANGSGRVAGNSGMTDAGVYADYNYNNAANPAKTLNLTFTGLTDSLTYDLLGGLASSVNHQNFTATWTLITGSTAGSSSFISDNNLSGNSGFGTFESISPDSGTIAVQLTTVNDALSEFLGVSAITLTANAVPEPQSFGLLGMGMLATFLVLHRRKK